MGLAKVILLLGFLIVLALVIYLLSKKNFTFVLQANPVALGNPCTSNTDCATGQSCDVGLCKLINGQVCVLSNDCLKNSYCSGLCTTATPNIINLQNNAPCPCAAGYTCVTNSNDNSKTCQIISPGSNYTNCNANTDCNSGWCYLGTCTASNLGAVCDNTSQCVPGSICKMGICTALAN